MELGYESSGEESEEEQGNEEQCLAEEQEIQPEQNRNAARTEREKGHY